MEDYVAQSIKSLLLVAPLLFLVAQLWRSLIVQFWLEPRSLETKLRSQGIKGPQMTFMAGNIAEVLRMRDTAKQRDMPSFNHDISGHVLVEYHTWSKQYGKVSLLDVMNPKALLTGKRFFYWWGTEPRIIVTEPELIREVLAKRLGQFDKSNAQFAAVIPLLGRGLVIVNGNEWSHHRRLVSPAFYMEKLKKMVPQCTVEMLDKLLQELLVQPEIEMCNKLSKMTADVISHTAFGSSYAKGQKVFKTMGKIAQLLSKPGKFSWIPGRSFLPVPANFRLRKLRQEMNSLLMGMIKERRAGGDLGNDLLGLMLAECESASFDDLSVIEECKTFYLAGHETTAALLSWTTLLMAWYPEWQERARIEAQDVCRGGPPDADSISMLKLINMILLESVRLYPPLIVMLSACLEDTTLGDIYVPKGAAIMFPILAIHHDKELWGDDASEFKPERFKNGAAKAAKHPNAFMAFSLGPRVCIGQSFALIEAKVFLATFLQRFRFRLSPSYQHRPAVMVTLKPHQGLPILLEEI